MNLFTQDKTNWKYILIVVILAIFVGGVVLWYVTKPEILPTEFPGIKKPEKLEEIEVVTKTPTIAGLLNDLRLSGAKEIYVLGKYAYITGKEILTIADISNPKNPVIVSSISHPKSVGSNGLFVSNGYAYVLTGESPVAGVIPSLTIINISNPAFPTIVGSISNPKLGGVGGIQGIYVLDKYAYVVSESRALVIIDVSDPRAPAIISSVSITDPKILSWPYKVFVSDKYAYIASFGVGAETLIVDVSNPKTPTVVGRISGPKNATDIFVVDKYVYVIGAENILVIIDASDPAAPEIVSSLKDPKLEGISGIYVLGKYAYVSTREGLVIVDISIPEKPVIVSSVFDRRLEGAKAPYVLGRYVYLPASDANNLAIIDLKGEIVFSPKPISVLPKETLELKEEFVGKNEREIAFLQNGDIWVMNKDLKKKYKIVDTKEAITYFSLSPDGKEIYWLNEKGELWKKEEGKLAIPLAGLPGKLEYEKYKGEVEKYKQDFLKICKEIYEPDEICYKEDLSRFDELGRIKAFYLSPDGEYIAYEPLAGYTGCCVQIFNARVTSLWIMKKDGTEKVEVERPPEVRRELVIFDGWLPGSKKILFHFRDPDEATQGSAYFEVGTDGKNPKVYTEIFKILKEGVEVNVEDLSAQDIADITTMVVGTEPVYSPTGEKVAYIKEETEIRLKDIKTRETKTILTLEEFPIPFGPASRVLIWSGDGSLLSVKGLNKIFIFNKEGKNILKIEFDAEEIGDVVFSPDNKYLGGVYRIKGERISIIFFIDLVTKEKKEFKLPEFKEISETISIRPKLFINNRFYYLVAIESKEPEIKNSFPQLWVVDTNTWKNYKIAESVSEVIRLP